MEYIVSFLVGLLCWVVLTAVTRRGRKADNRAPPPDIVASKRKAQSEAAVKEQIPGFPLAKVINVIDGDTIIVAKPSGRVRIRLDSIDCPEDGQDWGDTARYGLVKLIGGRRVRLEEHGTDIYGRTLATIYVQLADSNDYQNVNERMVVLGHAWVMPQHFDHLPQDRQNKLVRLENWASSRKVGLWRAANPIPPWQWRKDHRSNEQAQSR